jgi:hypothetical protein
MSTKRSPRKKSKNTESLIGPRWLLPTNHYNLMYWLAAGLVLPPSAMTKYYSDCLAANPGWIPLFRNHLPRAALDQADTPQKSPILLDFDLRSLAGMVKGISSTGEVCDARLPDATADDLALILIPAPLPAHWIRKIIFSSLDARDEFQSRCEEYGNLSTIEIPLEVADLPTTTDMLRQPWPPRDGQETPPAWPERAILHDGAILALLHSLGNRSATAQQLATIAFSATSSPLASEEFREGINALLRQGVRREVGAMRIELYWGAVDHLRASVAATTVAGATGRISPEQAILDYLDAQGRSDAISGTKLQELAEDLRQALGLGVRTIKELLDRHPGPFAHALLLFFLRKHADELLDFDSTGFLLAEGDLLAATILFGLREDWMAMPPSLRAVPGLYNAIAHRMAASIQRSFGNQLDLGIAPSCPTLRELFSGSDGRWPEKIKDAAFALIRSQGWQDALETRVHLAKGTYRAEITAAGVQIVLPGEIKAVTTEVQQNRLLEHLAQLRSAIDPNIETEVRSMAGLS